VNYVKYAGFCRKVNKKPFRAIPTRNFYISQHNKTHKPGFGAKGRLSVDGGVGVKDCFRGGGGGVGQGWGESGLEEKL
jgi:hypothetical protein